MKRTHASLLPPLPVEAFTCLHNRNYELLCAEYVESEKYNLDASEPPEMLTVLCKAAFWHHASIVPVLLKCGASLAQCSPYVCDKNGLPPNFEAPPLFFAIESNDVDMVQLLVDAGADVNVKLAGSVPLVYYVASLIKGRSGTKVAALLALLFQAGARVDSLESHFDPFLYLLGAKQFELAKLVLHYCGPTDARTQTGESALQLLLSLQCTTSRDQAAQADLCRQLYRGNEDVDAFKYKKTLSSALHLAAECFNVELINWLIDVGCGVHGVDGNQRTPLQAALSNVGDAATFRYEAVLRLMNAECHPFQLVSPEPRAVPAEALTWLHHNHQVHQMVECVASGNYNLDTIEPPATTTLLCEAAFHRRYTIVRMLLDHGASIHQCSPYKFNKEFLPPHFLAPPLFFAIDSGDVAMIHLFIDRGADVTVLLNNSVPLLYYLIAQTNFLESQMVELVSRFVSAGACVNVGVQNPSEHMFYRARFPLLSAVKLGLFTVANVLLARGADTDVRTAFNDLGAKLVLSWECFSTRDRDAQRALFERLYSGSQQQAGSVATFFWDDGDSPLHVAARSNHVELVERLVTLGCSVTHLNKEEQTPLDAACGTKLHIEEGCSNYKDEMNGKVKIIHALIQAGATIKPDSHAAATGNKLWDVMFTILAAGADVNAQITKEGDTALTMALTVAGNNAAAVRRLIQLGADVNVRVASGMTPLLLACFESQGDSKLVLELLRAGADVNAECVLPGMSILLTPLTSVNRKLPAFDDPLHVIALLMKCGANKFTADYSGLSVWHVALKSCFFLRTKFVHVRPLVSSSP